MDATTTTTTIVVYTRWTQRPRQPLLFCPMDDDDNNHCCHTQWTQRPRQPLLLYPMDDNDNNHCLFFYPVDARSRTRREVVALLIVFIGALSGKDPPLNPLMMLWVNLIMDTMGALALGTEAPTLELLDRRPYKRNAPLISRPMMRNILVQSCFQVRVFL
ncbi:unnamed protein product, partial [Laminaria digitata]